jgi:AcrR family transcriptional regulator
MANVQAYIKSMPTPTGSKRVRDPEAHRIAILSAARRVFAERGYSKATIREVARRAGVTHGLVVLHFTTKEKLFIDALLERSRVTEAPDVEADALPELIARDYVERIEADGPNDPFVALVRSAGDTDVAKQLLRAMRREPADAYLATLDISDLEQRSDLLGAFLIGVTFSRYVLADGQLAAMSADELIAYLVPPIRSILFEPRGTQFSV